VFDAVLFYAEDERRVFPELVDDPGGRSDVGPGVVDEQMDGVKEGRVQYSSE